MSFIASLRSAFRRLPNIRIAFPAMRFPDRPQARTVKVAVPSKAEYRDLLNDILRSNDCTRLCVTPRDIHDLVRVQQRAQMGEKRLAA